MLYYTNKDMDSITFGLFFYLYYKLGGNGGPLLAREDDAIILKQKKVCVSKFMNIEKHFHTFA